MRKYQKYAENTVNHTKRLSHHSDERSVYRVNRTVLVHHKNTAIDQFGTITFKDVTRVYSLLITCIKTRATEIIEYDKREKLCITLVIFFSTSANQEVSEITNGI